MLSMKLKWLNMVTPTLPEEPTKEGFDFVGWFKDFNRTQEFDFEEDVVESI